jgi:nitrate reductase NapE component
MSGEQSSTSLSAATWNPSGSSATGDKARTRASTRFPALDIAIWPISACHLWGGFD